MTLYFLCCLLFIVGMVFMPWMPCCCNCDSYSDAFAYSDTSTVTGWTEDVGNAWEVVSQQLYESGTANARIICDHTLPLSSAGEMVAFASIYDYNVNDVFRLYVAWVSSAEYYLVEATYTGSDSWDIELFHNAGSLATATQTATVFTSPTDHVILRGCIDSDGNFRGGVLSAVDDDAWITDTGTPTGRKAGLGHNNTVNGATFDDFYLTELRAHQKSITCYNCWCWCLDNVASKELLGTVYNAVDRSACMDALTFDLDYNWGAGTPYWSGTLVVTGGTGMSLGFKLICGGDDGDEAAPGKYWTLEKIAPNATACCTNTCGPINPLTSSTCQPINLVFGPFNMNDSDLVCTACYDPTPAPGPASGSYYIVVTDKNE